jgi:hypothetical protein
LGVYVGNKLMGKGSGPSKQVAQQQAAQAALDEYAYSFEDGVLRLELMNMVRRSQ